jgi:hypothetical protein
LRSVEPTRIVLDHGVLPADPDTLVVDCSAAGITTPPKIPVFDRDTINLLMLRFCQPLFSAALIAYVEAHVSDVGEKNALCTPVPSPERPTDWLRMWDASLANAARWRENEGLRDWLSQCRLNNLNAMTYGLKRDDAAKVALLREVGPKAAMAAARLPALIAAIG